MPRNHLALYIHLLGPKIQPLQNVNNRLYLYHHPVRHGSVNVRWQHRHGKYATDSILYAAQCSSECAITEIESRLADATHRLAAATHRLPRTYRASRQIALSSPACKSVYTII